MPTASRAQAAAVARVHRAEQGFVDVAHEASLEFAPTGPPNRSTSRKVDAGVRRAPIAVGPGRPAIVVPAVPMEGGLPGAMPEFPIQLNKVQSPPLREQTLARDRLLDWLGAKIHDRVVLVIAEAGYGKTTLLADFSRRTRLRTLWYRLDRGDRDWVGFIAHLAAAVRVHVPDFGPATAALLRETATTAPSRDVVLDTFVRELGELPADATVLILDDFHLVDDNADIRHITRELLARAPERLTFAFASRRVPPVPLARLRALGEVAELGTDDLRFDEAETDRLFRETYDMPLERGLISELSKRTEGWAASLQLVRAALHDRDAVQARAFIGSLSGAEGHLYDYLAEEVIGDLPPALQDFLMRTSILETIDLELGSVAAGVSPDVAGQLLMESERLGFALRRGKQGRGQVRLHPLVREFLMARLGRIASRAELIRLHHDVAAVARNMDWRVAAHHYLSAGEPAEARSVVSASLDLILASGAYASALALIGSGTDATDLLIASRLAILDADPDRGLALAEQALQYDPSSSAAVLTLMSARSLAGDVAGAISAGADLEVTASPFFARVARSMRAVLETSVSGSLRFGLEELDHVLESLAPDQARFRGIAELLRAHVLISSGDPTGALASAERSIKDLESTSAGSEVTSARLAQATALAFLGLLREARSAGSAAERDAPVGQRLELRIEIAWLESAFGDEDLAATYLDSVATEIAAGSDHGIQGMLICAELALRQGHIEVARQFLEAVPPDTLRTSVAFEARRRLTAARERLISGDVSAASSSAQLAISLALSQGAETWANAGRLLHACALTGAKLNMRIAEIAPANQWVISFLAEELLSRILDLDMPALHAVRSEIQLRPERWRASIRRALDGASSVRVRNLLGELLAQVGTREDVIRLKRIGGGGRNSVLARSLARRLADPVVVEDLGRIRIVVGERAVEGSETRRRVLGLIAFLLTREGFSSTRDEVLDALWPDLEPSSALNSLNQTVYFLRRVFEPQFREDESPGYLHQDGETIWLDRELVDSRSRQCQELIHALTRQPDSDGALRLADTYIAKFALDFAYEEWASAYRDSLHATYLRVIEQAVREDMNGGQFNRAIAMAERAAAVEPDSEEIQVALIRLYRLAGAYAAAAEQYGRYSSGLRSLGVEVPSIEVVLGSSEAIGTPAY